MHLGLSYYDGERTLTRTTHEGDTHTTNDKNKKHMQCPYASYLLWYCFKEE